MSRFLCLSGISWGRYCQKRREVRKEDKKEDDLIWEVVCRRGGSDLLLTVRVDDFT